MFFVGNEEGAISFRRSTPFFYGFRDQVVTLARKIPRQQAVGKYVSA